MSGKLFFYVLMALFCGQLLAQKQQEVRIQKDAAGEVFLADGRVNYRVGSGVAVRVYVISAGGINYSARILFGCDGSWVTDQFYLAINMFEGTTESKLASMRNSETQDVEAPVARTHPDDSEINYIKSIKPRIKQLCATSALEPRNTRLPITITKEVNGTYETVSVVTGTALRNAGQVEAWFRLDEIKKTERLRPDGTPMVVSGSQIYKRDLTGKYSMIRYLIDCRKEVFGVLQFLEYSVNGTVKSSFSNERNKLQLEPAVPDSIGESIVEWACLLYK